MPSDAWLMQNYRFVHPPLPTGPPVNQVVAQLQEVQMTLLNILHKANFDYDYEAALAAAAQATANAQLLGMITGVLRPAAPPGAPPAPNRPPTGAVAPQEEDPIYLIAFQDHTIKAATAVWRDDLMLHYMTREGGHEQVRLDLVDWKFSTELNHHANTSAAGAGSEDRGLTPVHPAQITGPYRH
jgi:hypothetical protein